jgi:hypothetical protein
MVGGGSSVDAFERSNNHLVQIGYIRWHIINMLSGDRRRPEYRVAKAMKKSKETQQQEAYEEPNQDKLFFFLVAVVIVVFTSLVVDRILRG